MSSGPRLVPLTGGTQDQSPITAWEPPQSWTVGGGILLTKGMLGPLTLTECLKIQGLSKRSIRMQETGAWKVRVFCSELESFLQNQEAKEGYV